MKVFKVLVAVIGGAVIGAVISNLVSGKSKDQKVDSIDESHEAVNEGEEEPVISTSALIETLTDMGFPIPIHDRWEAIILEIGQRPEIDSNDFRTLLFANIQNDNWTDEYAEIYKGISGDASSEEKS